MSEIIRINLNEELENLINNFTYEYITNLLKFDTDQKASNTIVNFLSDLKLINVFLLLRSNNLANLVDKIFSDEYIRDYILSATFNISLKLCNLYLINYGNKNNEENLMSIGRDLMHDVVDSLISNDEESSILPDAIKDSITYSEDYLTTLFESNKWLMTIILIIVYYKPDKTY